MDSFCSISFFLMAINLSLLVVVFVVVVSHYILDVQQPRPPPLIPLDRFCFFFSPFQETKQKIFSFEFVEILIIKNRHDTYSMNVPCEKRDNNNKKEFCFVLISQNCCFTM